ncbi:hypothetical protein OH807_00695 [Kitasatospora sp. NBC_01560]|uniref:hypothetical protein n=1 Tax=Kitasatospora sp. NBC_01560 TaxID=2975965 RepID=UPI00386F754B
MTTPTTAPRHCLHPPHLVPAGPDAIWQAVTGRRVGELVVENHDRTIVEATDGHLTPAPAGVRPTGTREIREGTVDEDAERSVQAGCTVTSLPDGTATVSPPRRCCATEAGPGPHPVPSVGLPVT